MRAWCSRRAWESESYCRCGGQRRCRWSVGWVLIVFRLWKESDVVFSNFFIRQRFNCLVVF